MFFRNVGNYFLHFIFMFVVLSTALGIALMFVGLGIGALISVALGTDDLTNSPSAMGGLAVGVSVAIVASFFLSIYGTFKVKPTEESRRKFIASASQMLGRPNLAGDLGYGPNVKEEGDDEGDWYTRARDRSGREEEDYPRR